ncbi:MAG: ubiquinone/menaquinone biosynthesis methyltransferase [Candidatus Porifericomitaceae bacterium WSBS_2022_MAG_OTU9]
MTDMEKVDFGFSKLGTGQHAKSVHQIFAKVALGYDTMNDIMSFGLHRLWKQFAVHLACLRPGHYVLDVAGGTGDIARLCLPRVGSEGRVVLLDINHAMLREAGRRDIDAGIAGSIEYILGDASKPPFAAASFDVVIVAFGLRNMPARSEALESLCKLLRAGGQLLVLEFSRPESPPFAKMFRWYCLKALPAMGQLVLKDADSYRYLGESIQSYPSRNHIGDMLLAAGFAEVHCNVLGAGIVTLHKALKI